jgi:hypothetical protein
MVTIANFRGSAFSGIGSTVCRSHAAIRIHSAAAYRKEKLRMHEFCFLQRQDRSVAFLASPKKNTFCARWSMLNSCTSMVIIATEKSQ